MRCIELGMQVEDTASGFRGMVTARGFYMNGCIRYGVLPKAVKTDILNGNSQESWIDNYRLKPIASLAPHVPQAQSAPQPSAAPKQTSTPVTKAPGGPSTRLVRAKAPR